jgi:hypothetical protein
VLFTLDDGRKVNANSNAQTYFIELSEADRKAAIPCLWTVNKYEDKKCSSSIESLGQKIGSTKIPSFAHLIGGSSADFDKLEAAIQTRVAVAPIAVIEPSKSVHDDLSDIPF